MGDRPQLLALSKPFTSKFVHGNPSGGGSYVKHHVVLQRLLFHLGPCDFQLVEILRGEVAEKKPIPEAKSKRGKEGAPALANVVVGAVCRLRCEIDGRHVQIEEAGDCEEPHNWPHDGARLKDAMSDAFKRCCMRIGLGTHLWSQDEYFLTTLLEKETSGEAEA